MDIEVEGAENELYLAALAANCRGDMARLAANGVEIVEEAAEVPWGVSGVIRDLYGNPYNLVGPD